ncbi:MAG: amidohydrolase [Pseudomonadota bacterium]
MSIFAQQESPVDTAYFNGTVWAGVEGAQDASVLTVKNGLIRYVGNDLAQTKGAVRKVDLAGGFLMHGFIDNHVHFIEGGAGLASVDLRDANTPELFKQRIADYAADLEPGRWVLFGNWDHELWGGELPTRHWIDAETGDTPVFVMRLDGHMGLANTAALKLAGITRNSVADAEGEIIRDQTGEPTGILKDSAMNPVLAVIPKPSDAEVVDAIKAAQQHALSLGVTQVHAVTANANEVTMLDAFRLAHQQGELQMRAYVLTPLEHWQSSKKLIENEGYGDSTLKWGGVKGFVDGSLGSTTAWFYQPYIDKPETNGFALTKPPALQTLVNEADDAGIKLAIHAIGDQAIDVLIDAFENTAGDQIKARRYRIEHFQHPSKQAIERAAEHGIIVSMQPYHAIDDGRWAEKRIGKDRIKTTYAFKSILDVGGLLSFGSDWPVAPLSPLSGVYAAVTRQTTDGANPHGWQPQEKISVSQALRAYTSTNAYAAFEDDVAGTLEAGKRADLVILNQDPRKIDPGAIPTIQVLSTIIDGKPVYQAD